MYTVGSFLVFKPIILYFFCVKQPDKMPSITSSNQHKLQNIKTQTNQEKKKTEKRKETWQDKGGLK